MARGKRGLRLLNSDIGTGFSENKYGYAQAGFKNDSFGANFELLCQG
jgi:hypothetical protein